MIKKNKNAGFTLIELMIVVAILGTLASIAVPKFGNLIRQAKEGATKGNLGAFRSALRIYYADTEGSLPLQISNAGVGSGSSEPHPDFVQYLVGETLPINHIDGTISSEALNFVWDDADGNYVFPDDGPNGEGDGWVYFRISGRIHVNNNSTDVAGIRFTSW